MWKTRLTKWWRGLWERYPALAGRERLAAWRSDEPEAWDGGAGWEQAARDLASHVWVHKAVRVWADSLAALECRVIGHGGQALGGHPVSLLLSNPNETTTPGDLWRRWATDMALGGECGWEVAYDPAGAPARLYHRSPVEFAVRPDPARRRYGLAQAYILDPDRDNAYALTPDEFKHFRFYNPLNPWRGLAPLSAVRQGVVIDQLIQAWSRLFFRNQARPDYALIAPQGLTPSEREQFELELGERFGRGEGWHRPIVLEKGVTDLKVFSFPRKDLEWLQQRRLSRDEIGAVFGVPDEIMGYGRDTYENFDTAERVLWSLTLSNLCGFRDEQVTHFFRRLGRLTPEERIQTDLSRVWALRRAAAQQLRDAETLFRMGVPLHRIDALLGLGIGEVPHGELPFGGRAGPMREPEPPPSDQGDARDRPDFSSEVEPT